MNAKQKQAQALEQHFMFLHENPPNPFNPDFDPKAPERSRIVTQSMVNDNYYATHTREECSEEWKWRYDHMKQEGQ